MIAPRKKSKQNKAAITSDSPFKHPLNSTSLLFTAGASSLILSDNNLNIIPMVLHASSSIVNFLALCSLIPQSISAPTKIAFGPTVALDSGVVIGTTARPSNQLSLKAANVYLGVPFAQSPPERFSPPKAAPAWSSPLIAQNVKPACIQQFMGTGEARRKNMEYFNNPPTNEAPEESEDCLYLNVYTPPHLTAKSKKAVMFWLYGVRNNRPMNPIPTYISRAIWPLAVLGLQGTTEPLLLSTRMLLWSLPTTVQTVSSVAISIL